jgi:hypothetical protein
VVVWPVASDAAFSSATVSAMAGAGTHQASVSVTARPAARDARRTLHDAAGPWPVNRHPFADRLRCER